MSPLRNMSTVSAEGDASASETSGHVVFFLRDIAQPMVDAWNEEFRDYPSVKVESFTVDVIKCSLRE